VPHAAQRPDWLAGLEGFELANDEQMRCRLFDARTTGFSGSSRRRDLNRFVTYAGDGRSVDAFRLPEHTTVHWHGMLAARPRRPDPSRETVPIACDEERSMPDARRTVTGGPEGE
jgi:hypothetical protein